MDDSFHLRIIQSYMGELAYLEGTSMNTSTFISFNLDKT